MKYIKLKHFAFAIVILAMIMGCSRKQDYSSTPASNNNMNNNTGGSSLTLGSNSPVPVGSTLNLTASSISGATYYWSGPAGFSSTVQNASRANWAPADAGTYTCTASTAGGYYGGQSYTASITVSTK